jgi:hypothetical protein
MSGLDSSAATSRAERCGPRIDCGSDDVGAHESEAYYVKQIYRVNAEDSSPRIPSMSPSYSAARAACGLDDAA